MATAAAIEEGIQFLAAHGLNLWAVFPCGLLPPDVAAAMRTGGAPVDTYARLVLVGNGGRQFWEALSRFGFRTDDPVDYFSIHLVERLVEEYLGGARSQIVYPGRPGAPLIRLGELAGWSTPSPIGPGIHPEYGLWFAYRVAFLTDAPLPVTEQRKPHRPCDECAEKPCIGACPAGAVRWPVDFQLEPCLRHRLAEGSACADKCLARLACPVATEHRYTPEQVRYHYLHSLPSVARYWEQITGADGP